MIEDRTDPDRALVAMMAATIYATVGSDGCPLFRPEEAVDEAHRLLHLVETRPAPEDCR